MEQWELKKAYVLKAAKADATFKQYLVQTFANKHDLRVQEADFWKDLTHPEGFNGVRNPSVWG